MSAIDDLAQARTTPQPARGITRGAWHLGYIRDRVAVVRVENPLLPDDVGQALTAIMRITSETVESMRLVIELIEGIKTPRDAMPLDLAHELHSMWDEAVAALKSAGIDVLAEMDGAAHLPEADQ
ncbi:hypothetical protein ACFVGM_09150 [Kitasatospora purpeofusca]|uniref:hypothetical protein n=1 Tax=Kitasatospora purpeofusca TaxID=67352 RepID=UPI003677462C